MPETDKPSFILKFFFPVIRLLGRLLIQILGPAKVTGSRNVPKRGGVLILCNHRSESDPVVIQAMTKRRIRFMAKRMLFDMKTWGPIIKWFRAFPVEPGQADRKAIRKAAELLNQGEAVCVFPEGLLAMNARIHPIQPGIALILKLANVPVICGGIINSEKLVPPGTMKPRFAHALIELNWGEPRRFADPINTDELLEWVRAEFLRLTREDPVLTETPGLQ